MDKELRMAINANFRSLEKYEKWAREWDAVRASLKTRKADLSQIKLVSYERRAITDEED